MTRRVLLLSMPFASIRYASPALSILKPLVEREGFSCDIAYLNIVFQAYTGRPDIYEMIADLMVVGEWVFGAELFGAEWAGSEDERLEALDIPLLPDGLKPEAVRDSLGRVHSIAGPFIQRCVDGMNWDNYSIIGFTSVSSQNVASLALARHIKERWPEKIIAFGGANCEEDMGRALLRLFPFVDWVFNGNSLSSALPISSSQSDPPLARDSRHCHCEPKLRAEGVASSEAISGMVLELIRLRHSQIKACQQVLTDGH